MKITKQRLKQIIKEELSGLGEGDSADRKWASNPSNPEFEGDETDQDSQVRLQQVASSLGAGEDFVAMVREAITNAVSSEGMGWDRALGTMVDALEMLLDHEPDIEEPVDDDEALVLGKDGPPSPEKIAKQQRQLKHGFEDWRK